MRLLKYVFLFENKNKRFAYNALNEGLIVIDQDAYNFLRKGDIRKLYIKKAER